MVKGLGEITLVMEIQILSHIFQTQKGGNGGGIKELQIGVESHQEK